MMAYSHDGVPKAILSRPSSPDGPRPPRSEARPPMSDVMPNGSKLAGGATSLDCDWDALYCDWNALPGAHFPFLSRKQRVVVVVDDDRAEESLDIDTLLGEFASPRFREQSPTGKQQTTPKLLCGFDIEALQAAPDEANTVYDVDDLITELEIGATGEDTPRKLRTSTDRRIGRVRDEVDETSGGRDGIINVVNLEEAEALLKLGKKTDEGHNKEDVQSNFLFTSRMADDLCISELADYDFDLELEILESVAKSHL